MKKSLYTLIAAWLLLICFIAGQGIVYSHQHHVLRYSKIHHQDANDHSPHQDISEKCKLCDAMHHTDMVLQQDTYTCILPTILHIHPVVVYDFKSFGLILAGGRSLQLHNIFKKSSLCL